jgi:tetratricopeptide (TPR) repeat protein
MEKYYAELSNIALLLLFASVLPFLGLFAYIVFKSPVFSPVHHWRAERAFRAKRYARAAKLYERLHDFESLRLGNVYAKKAALSYELSGQLRLARDWYVKAQDFNKVGALLIEQGKTEEAIALYTTENMPQRLAQLYEDQERYIDAAKVYQDLKQFRKQENLYRKAVIKGDEAVAHKARLLLAQLYTQQQRIEEARRFFDEASAALAHSDAYDHLSELLTLRDQVEFGLMRASGPPA